MGNNAPWRYQIICIDLSDNCVWFLSIGNNRGSGNEDHLAREQKANIVEGLGKFRLGLLSLFEFRYFAYSKSKRKVSASRKVPTIPV